MGAFCCCLNQEDFEEYTAYPNGRMIQHCYCLSFCVHWLFNMYSSVFYRVEGNSVSSSIQGVPSSSAGFLGVTSPDSSPPDTYRAPPRPLPYDTDPRYLRLQRDGLVSRRDKSGSHLHGESEPLRRTNSDGDGEPLTTLQSWNEADYEDQGQGYQPESPGKRQTLKAMMRIESSLSLMGDEDVCPTCLDGQKHANLECFFHGPTADVNMLEVATENLKEQVLKDGEDKATLKAEVKQLRQYISHLLHSPSQPALFLPQVLESSDDQKQLNQLVVYGKHTRDWIEDFVGRSTDILARLFELVSNSRKFMLGIDSLVECMTEMLPTYDRISTRLKTIGMRPLTKEHKPKMFSWSEQYSFMMKTSNDIASVFIEWKEKLHGVEKFVAEFVQHISCRYFTKDGLVCYLDEVQGEFQQLIRERFCGDPWVDKMYLLMEITVKFDKAEKSMLRSER